MTVGRWPMLPPSNFSARRPRRLGRKHLAVAARHVDRPLDRVEDEEFGLRTEVRDVAQAGRLEIRVGALRERARIALVALAVGRLDHVARDVERRLVQERVDVARGGIGHQEHVGRLDPLPPGDRRAVEGVPALELVHHELLGRHGDVLFLAAGIGEAKVDELDVLVLEHLEDVGGAGHAGLLVGGRRSTMHCKTAGADLSENYATTAIAPNARHDRGIGRSGSRSDAFRTIVAQ